MARVLTLNINGALGEGSFPYGYVIQATNYLLDLKLSYEKKVAEKQDIYSWEVPPDVILVTMDSSGGESNKLYTAMQSLKNLSKVFPTVGLVTGKACSAGYMLVSSCPTLLVIPGAEIGSIAAAACYVDNSEALKKKGLKAFFYKTHKDKFTGLPGDQTSDVEIENLLQTSADAYFSVLGNLLELNRPGISNEIKRLNGASFIVTGEETSPLFDSIVSSFEEVYYTLEGLNMNTNKLNFASLFGGNADVIKPNSVVSTTQTAGITTSAESSTAGISATGTILLSAEEQAKAEAMGAAMFQAFQAKTAEQFKCEGYKTGTLEMTAPQASASAASLEDLLKAGSVYKSSQAHLLEVAKMELPLEKANSVLKLLAAAGDASFSQDVSNISLSSSEVFSSDTSASAETDSIFTKVLSSVAKKTA